MTRENKIKIQELFSIVPKGTVLPLAWLGRHGISYKLAWWYTRSGWFERLGHGAYHFKNDIPTWEGAVYSLATLLELPVHIGAKSALTLLGRAHYVPMQSTPRVFLFSEPGINLPKWCTSHPKWRDQLVLIKRRLLKNTHDKWFVTREINSLPLRLSSPELAILEVMMLIPKHQTYPEAILLMENLSNLRPKVVQSLLECCISIKAKRLFLHAAQKHNHSWLSKLDINNIDLGRGVRTIAEGGSYDAKYQLAVPKLKEQ